MQKSTTAKAVVQNSVNKEEICSKCDSKQDDNGNRHENQPRGKDHRPRVLLFKLDFILIFREMLPVDPVVLLLLQPHCTVNFSLKQHGIYSSILSL